MSNAASRATEDDSCISEYVGIPKLLLICNSEDDAEALIASQDICSSGWPGDCTAAGCYLLNCISLACSNLDDQ